MAAISKKILNFAITLKLSVGQLLILLFFCMAPSVRAGSPFPGDLSPLQTEGSRNEWFTMIPTIDRYSVKNGEVLSVSVLLKSKLPVSTVQVDFGGLAKVPLLPTSGSHVLSTGEQICQFEGHWTASGLEEKVYIATVTAVDSERHSLSDSTLRFSDPAAGYSTVGTTSYKNAGLFVEKHRYLRNPGPSTSAIDSANNVVYLVFSSNPVNILKVNLSTFTIEDELILTGVSNSISESVIDPVSNVLYLAEGYTPGRIHAIDLDHFRLTESITLGDQEEYLSSMIFDQETRCLYVGSGFAGPGLVLKVGTHPLRRLSSIVFPYGEERPYSAVLDPASRMAYFVACTDIGKVVKVDLDTFTRVESTNLSVDDPYHTVLDASTNSLYTGSRYSPTKIVRVDLNTFTESGSLALGNEIDGIYTTAIDEEGRTAYFSSNSDSAPIVKLDLDTFSVADVIYLGPHTNLGTTMHVDGPGRRLLVGTYGDPSKLLRLKLEDLAVESSLVLQEWGLTASSGFVDPKGDPCYISPGTPSTIARLDQDTLKFDIARTLETGDDYLFSAMVDEARKLAYFATWTSPGHLVKIDLDSFQRVAGLTLDPGEDIITCCAMDPEGNFGYLGTDTIPSHIVKVDLSTMTRVGSMTLEKDLNVVLSAIVDDNGEFGYFGTSSHHVLKVNMETFQVVDDLENVGGSSSPGMFVPMLHSDAGKLYFAMYSGIQRVDLGTFSNDGFLYTSNSVESAVLDPIHNMAYLGGSYCAIRVDLSTFNDFDIISLPGNYSTDLAAVNPEEGKAYFADYLGSDILSRVDLDTFQVDAVAEMEVWNWGKFESLILSKGTGKAYLGTDTSRARIYEVDLETMTHTRNLELEAGDNEISSPIVDAKRNVVYMTTGSEPTKFIKLDLDTLKKMESITLEEGENGPACAIVDSQFRFAYIGTYAPAKVVKIDLETFTRVDAVTMPQSEDDPFLCGFMDGENEYAYFGIWDQPARVERIDLDPFARAGRIAITGEIALSATYDSLRNVGYFGTDAVNYGPYVCKVDLATFQQTGALPMPGYRIKDLQYDALADNLYYKTQMGGYYGHSLGKVNPDTFTLEGSASALATPATFWDLENRRAYYGGAYGYVTRMGLDQSRLLKGTRFELPEDALLTDLRFYCHQPPDSLRLSLYSDAEPKQLLWASGPISDASENEFLKVPVSTGVPNKLELPAGSYWAVWQIDSPLDVPSSTIGAADSGFVLSRPFGPEPIQINEWELTYTDEMWTEYITYVGANVEGEGWQFR